MIDHLWDWPKVGLYQEWDRPKVGVYKLKYEGHGLEITLGPAHPGRKEKRYTIWIDGIAVAKAWSSTEAKPRAIRLVDRSHEGKPLVPLAEIDTSEPTPWLPDDTKPRNGAASVDILRQTQFEIEAIQSQRGNDDSLYFTITGKLGLGSLTTLSTTVELLREGGQVQCDVVMPSRITL